MYYQYLILNSFIISCKSGKDSQDQQEESEVYEREYVEHGVSCKCCTSLRESKRIEKIRELWWKKRKIKDACIMQTLPEQDFFDPTTEYWNREDLGN
jgi:hypothetical protein